MSSSAAPHDPFRQAAPTSNDAVSDTPRPAPARSRLRGDITAVLGVTLVIMFAAWHFEASERLFYWTRAKESYQLDELPIVLLSFALMMLWFARRRFLEAQEALRLHDRAERRLADLLEENRRLARCTIDVQENERRNLARELHDEMGQYLNAIKIDAITLQRRVAPSGDPPEALAGIVRNVNHVYWVINDMIRRLRPVGLDELGLAAALENCIDGWRQRLDGTTFAFSTAGDLSGLDEQVNLTVYRMVQEGLTNVAKHAGATRTEVRVVREQDENRDRVIVSVLDDGRGMSAGLLSSQDNGSGCRVAGLGLIGMRERAQALQGELAIQPAGLDGRGFGFVAWIPVLPASPKHQS